MDVVVAGEGFLFFWISSSTFAINAFKVGNTRIVEVRKGARAVSKNSDFMPDLLLKNLSELLLPGIAYHHPPALGPFFLIQQTWPLEQSNRREETVMIFDL